MTSPTGPNCFLNGSRVCGPDCMAYAGAERVATDAESCALLYAVTVTVPQLLANVVNNLDRPPPAAPGTPKVPEQVIPPPPKVG